MKDKDIPKDKILYQYINKEQQNYANKYKNHHKAE
jgi:hypothetical protein